MRRATLLLTLLFVSVISISASASGAEDRTYTISLLRRIVDPVLIPLSENRLKREFPCREWERQDENFSTTYLQAFGRSLSGMSPWLSLGFDSSEEGQLRRQYAAIARKALANAVDSEATDYLFADPTQERIVHAAYIAYPLLMASEQLWEPLSRRVKERVIAELKTHREFKPNESNWLLFSAIIECAIWRFTGECDMRPIEYAVARHEEWYLGGGIYGDGDHFAWDYYNSYVIQPLLSEVLLVCQQMGSPLGEMLEEHKRRAASYCVVLEHLISPEGTFPVIGRSSVYRIAAFKLIGHYATRFGLPAKLSSGATRAALTAVARGMMEAEGTFDERGYLHAGLVGRQDAARDYYNYTGALYMCAMGLSHLGLPAESPFWRDPAQKWFQQRVWSGESVRMK